MEDANTLIPFKVATNWPQVEGTCPSHGPSTALLPPRSGWTEWYCSDCAMEAKAKQVEDARRQERKGTLDSIACLPERYTSERFEVSTPSQKKVRLTVRAFRDLIAAGGKWASLVLVGGTGTGKTLLACELARSVIDNLGLSVRYCTANQMITEIQAAYSTEGKTEEGELLRFTNYDLLVLDEVDAIRDSASGNAKLLLTELINRRYNAHKPVVAISNQPLEKLPKFIGDRVFSRLQENRLLCVHDWADQRPLSAS